MPEPINEDFLHLLVARLRAKRNDERGEVTLEPVLLTTCLIALAVPVIGLGVAKLIGLLASF
jgi:hypothetical protein